MIRIESITTNIPDIEQVLIEGEAIEGSENLFVCSIFKESLSEEDKLLYDDALALIASTYHTRINNTTSRLDISRTTSIVLSDGVSEIDFQSLSVDDQNKLKAFLALVIRLKNEDKNE